MDKVIKAEMLTGLGPVIPMAFKALYPMGLTLEELERRSHEHQWLAKVYKYVARRGDEL